MEKFFADKKEEITKLIQNKYSNIWNVRIFQKDLIFITGIPVIFANKELLMSKEFLG